MRSILSIRTIAILSCRFVFLCCTVFAAVSWAQDFRKHQIETADSTRGGAAHDLNAPRQSLLPNVSHFFGPRQISESYKLQALWCETASSNPSIQNVAIRNKLPKTGGWFSVHRLMQLLDEDAMFERNLRKHKGDSDIYFDRPSDLALRILPELLPQAGIPKPDYPDRAKTRLIQSWKKWVSEHESDLKKLEPTGAGVSFSVTACNPKKSAGKPGAPAFDFAFP